DMNNCSLCFNIIEWFRAWSFVLSLLILALTPGQGSAASNDVPAKVDRNRLALRMMTPNSYLCYRATHPLVIDGTLNDPAWRNAPWTADFVDIEGDAKPAPPLRTRVKMLWDDNYLYVGAHLEEPHVWATLTQHDSVIFQDNDFEIFIDPDGDNHNYYEIEINALNTVWDLRLPKPYRDGGTAINEWGIPGLRTAVHVDGTLNDPRDTDRSWSVVLAIPWRVLGEYAGCPSPPRNGDQWRINFSRVEWDTQIMDGHYHKIPKRREHNWVWSPQGVIDMHRPEHWGYVQFSTDAPGKATLRRDPSLPARNYLMQVYDAQQEYKKQTGHYATTLTNLTVSKPPVANDISQPTLHVTNDGFEATIDYVAEDKSIHRLHVQADSRLWSTPLHEQK
ncbi:MAG: carbohydrate-binding family 9-like protein, partial [Abitibacteriaceae bacterium]|nr:carbohydrate-binding family 9-like protein [Abditibacteriaceae bacterium]